MLFPLSPNARHVVVYLVALPASAVSAAQQNLSQSPEGITPEAFSLAVRDLQAQWPDDGSLVLQLNAGQAEEQAWFPSDMVCSVLSLSGRELIIAHSVGRNATRCLWCCSRGHEFAQHHAAQGHGGCGICGVLFSTYSRGPLRCSRMGAKSKVVLFCKAALRIMGYGRLDLRNPHVQWRTAKHGK